MSKEFLQDDGQLRVFIVPVDIMDVPDLTIYEQMAYMVLRSYVNPTDPTAFPSYPTIARRGRMSKSSAIRAIEGLIQKGLIMKEIRLDVSKNRKIKHTSNRYTLITPKRQGSVSQTRGVVSHRHGGGVSQTPEHNHLKKTSLNMNDCMSNSSDSNNLLNTNEPLETPCKNEVENEIMDALSTYVPKHCYADNFPLGQAYIAEIYLMLLKQFQQRLSAEIVRMAAERYFDRACVILPGGVVANKFDVKNPVGLFYECYTEAIKLYKAQNKPSYSV